MEVVVAEERKRKNYADFWNIIPLKEPFRVILSDIRDRCATQQPTDCIVAHKKEQLHKLLPNHSQNHLRRHFIEEAFEVI